MWSRQLWFGLLFSVAFGAFFQIFSAVKSGVIYDRKKLNCLDLGPNGHCPEPRNLIGCVHLCKAGRIERLCKESSRSEVWNLSLHKARPRVRTSKKSSGSEMGNLLNILNEGHFRACFSDIDNDPVQMCFDNLVTEVWSTCRSTRQAVRSEWSGSHFGAQESALAPSSEKYRWYLIR